MTEAEFEQCVEEALRDLPQEIAAMMENIEVLVVDRPTREERRRARVGPGARLLGLYSGVPLGRRGRHRYGGVLPDRVLIYREPLEATYPPERLVDGIRRTVLHEVGHHFGLSDARLRELGY